MQILYDFVISNMYIEKHLSLITLRLGSDPEKLFPYVVFMSEVKKFGKHAAFVGAFLSAMMTGDVEKMPDIDDTMVDMAENLHAKPECLQAFDEKVLDLYDDLAIYEYI